MITIPIFGREHIDTLIFLTVFAIAYGLALWYAGRQP